MNSFVQTILNGMASGNAKGQLIDVALNWLLNQPQAVAFCKSLNWDVANMREVIKGGINYFTTAYNQKIPFERTEQQRKEDGKNNYLRLKGFSCLSELEKSVLAFRMAGFNAQEVQEGLAIQNQYSVEQVIEIGETAYKKYAEVAQAGGIGSTKSTTEPPSQLDLKSIISGINAADSNENNNK